MEFKISRQNFLDALSKTQGVVEKRNTMPVLSNLLLDASENSLKVTGTDLEVAVMVEVPAQVMSPGKITVLARSLHDIVRELNQEEVRVVLKEGDRIELKAGPSQFVIPGLSAAEFPSLPDVEAKQAEWSSTVLSGMIGRTSYAMSTDETRHNLSGVLLQRKGKNQVRMVATDGHRLAMVDQELASDGAEVEKVIIPRKGVLELKKIAFKEGNIKIAIGAKNMVAKRDNEMLFIRLVDGEYPDYERVVPQKNDKLVKIPRERLTGALRRVSLLSNERSRGVILSFSSGHLEISIANPDLGEAREDLEADYRGESLSVGFNARYFLDALSAMNEETTTLALSNNLSPCLIRSEKDNRALCVIMPMRI